MSRGTPDTLSVCCLSHTGLSPSMVSAFKPLILLDSILKCWVHYPAVCFHTPVWALPLSLATTYGITVVFFSCGYLDVSVPRVSLHYTMDSCNDDYASIVAGFPHSEICASSDICSYTQLIAACHVLRRLLVPRHSPCALNSLTYNWFSLKRSVLFFVNSS